MDKLCTCNWSRDGKKLKLTLNNCKNAGTTRQGVGAVESFVSGKFGSVDATSSASRISTYHIEKMARKQGGSLMAESSGASVCQLSKKRSPQKPNLTFVFFMPSCLLLHSRLR